MPDFVAETLYGAFLLVASTVLLAAEPLLSLCDETGETAFETAFSSAVTLLPAGRGLETAVLAAAEDAPWSFSMVIGR